MFFIYLFPTCTVNLYFLTTVRRTKNRVFPSSLRCLVISYKLLYLQKAANSRKNRISPCFRFVTESLYTTLYTFRAEKFLRIFGGVQFLRLFCRLCVLCLSAGCRQLHASYLRPRVFCPPPPPPIPSLPHYVLSIPNAVFSL